LETVFDTRSLPSIEITLSKKALDTSDMGYQPPIDESLVKEYDPDAPKPERKERSSTGRGKGKGKGRRLVRKRVPVVSTPEPALSGERKQ